MKPFPDDNSQPQPLPWLALWCVEFAMFFPSGPRWYAERFRTFRVAQYSGLLFDKPPGAWALRGGADGITEWAPVERANIGPRMRHVTDVVSAMPGCTREQAVEAAEGYLPASGRYGPLDRAISRGLIMVDWADGDHVRLFTSGAVRRIWYLRRELREPGITAARVNGIWAEIDELQAARAQSWAASDEA